MQVSQLVSYAKSRRVYNRALRDYRAEMRARVEAVTSPRPEFRFSIDLPGAVDEQRGDIPAFRAATADPDARIRRRRSDRPAQADFARVPDISRKGMSLRAACALLGTIAFVLLLVWMVELNAGLTARREIAAVQTRIEDLKAENEALRDAVQETRSETSIGYEAVQMGLISSKGVSAVYLSVPGNANMLLADSGTFAK